MFTKYKKIMENGVSGHLCDRLGNHILVYGGSNFENKYDRKVHDEYYIYDLNFNLENKGVGKICPESGIKIKNEEVIWYILNDKIYKIYLDDINLIEEEYFKLPHSFNGGFGCFENNNLIFGKDRVFKFNLETKELKELSNFIGEARNQSVYTKYDKYIYLLGGASNVAYLDSYRYDIDLDKWEKLNDLEISFLGSESIKIDEDNLLIIGGFNKEVYDNAVINLKDPGYKKIYFEINREDFKWNKKILKYNFKTQEIKVLEENIISAICGGTLIEIDNIYYLVMGEIKPGLRSTDVYKYEMENI